MLAGTAGCIRKYTKLVEAGSLIDPKSICTHGRANSKLASIDLRLDVHMRSTHVRGGHGSQQAVSRERPG